MTIRYAMRNCKIQKEQITWGEWYYPDEEAQGVANELMSDGYRRTSSAYCTQARIDREDWLIVLAKDMNCCVADFIKLDGSGVDDRWRDHYIRVYSRDKITISPTVSKYMKSY